MGKSRGEIKIATLLDKAEVIYLEEVSFPKLVSSRGNPLRFDFAVYETNQDVVNNKPKFLIEYQGEQHYKQTFTNSLQFAEQKKNDEKKRNYCRAKRITLVEVPYSDYQIMDIDYLLTKGKYFD